MASHPDLNIHNFVIVRLFFGCCFFIIIIKIIVHYILLKVSVDVIPNSCHESCHCHVRVIFLKSGPFCPKVCKNHVEASICYCHSLSTVRQHSG